MRVCSLALCMHFFFFVRNLFHISAYRWLIQHQTFFFFSLWLVCVFIYVYVYVCMYLCLYVYIDT